MVRTAGYPHPSFVAKAGIGGRIEISVGRGSEGDCPLVGDDHEFRALPGIRVFSAAEVEGTSTGRGAQEEPGWAETPFDEAFDHGGHIPLDIPPGVVVDHIGHGKGGNPLSGSVCVLPVTHVVAPRQETGTVVVVPTCAVLYPRGALRPVVGGGRNGRCAEYGGRENGQQHDDRLAHNDLPETQPSTHYPKSNGEGW